MATIFNREQWLNYKNNGIKTNGIENKEDVSALPVDIAAIYKKAKESNINTNPLDIVKVIKEIFHIELYYNDLDRNISGFIERIGPEKWAIHVNKWENPLRQKFTLAHELGHFILHKNILQSGSHFDNILYRDENSSSTERAANDFASKLLMPEQMFENAIKEGCNTIDKLAQNFQLSTSAVRYRAYKLNYISEY